jgi:hypothetical protein
VLLQYNLDQGIQYRAGVVYEKHGFRKEPYAARHELFGNYSSGRKSFMITYTADLKKLIGNNDLVISLLSRGPHNVSNFLAWVTMPISSTTTRPTLTTTATGMIISTVIFS